MHFGLIDYSYIDKAQKGDHPGFLTSEHCEEHRCMEKGCHYFLPKPKQEKAVAKKSDPQSEIVSIASKAISAFEGMKIMRAEKSNTGDWRVKYIAISNAYPIREITQHISEAIGETVVMINMNYDFEIAARLIFSM